MEVPAGPVPLFRDEGRGRGTSSDGVLSNTYERTREMVEEGMTLDEIAESRGLARNTVIGHLERIARQGVSLDLARILPDAQRFARIEQAFQQSGGVLLTPVKEILGDEYDYEELKLARIQLFQTGKLPSD